MRRPEIAFFLLFLMACHPASEEALPKAPTPVRVRVVEERTQQSAARYSGSIEPGTRVDLAFKVGGYIQDLAMVKSDGTTHKIQEGDWVTSGTVLAVVRQSDYAQRVTAASASLADSVAAQKQAQLDFDRSSKLLAGNSVSKAEVDTMTARLDRASAQVDGAKSGIVQAQLALADCTLRAPMDGVVLKRPIEVGSLVAPGSLGFVLADTRSVKVVFGAPDTLIEKLKIGGELSITLDAAPGAELTGKISRIAPSADPKSRVFDVEATIPNPKDQLKVGMIASLKVPEAALTGGSLALPLTAVVRSPRDTRGFSVFVVEGAPGQELARLRDVKLGDVLGNTVLVAEGLKKSERVITMGATLVTDGDAIRVIP